MLPTLILLTWAMSPENHAIEKYISPNQIANHGLKQNSADQINYYNESAITNDNNFFLRLVNSHYGGSNVEWREIKTMLRLTPKVRIPLDNQKKIEFINEGIILNLREEIKVLDYNTGKTILRIPNPYSDDEYDPTYDNIMTSVNLNTIILFKDHILTCLVKVNDHYISKKIPIAARNNQNISLSGDGRKLVYEKNNQIVALDLHDDGEKTVYEIKDNKRLYGIFSNFDSTYVYLSLYDNVTGNYKDIIVDTNRKRKKDVEMGPRGSKRLSTDRSSIILKNYREIKVVSFADAKEVHKFTRDGKTIFHQISNDLKLAVKSEDHLLHAIDTSKKSEKNENTDGFNTYHFLSWKEKNEISFCFLNRINENSEIGTLTYNLTKNSFTPQNKTLLKNNKNFFTFKTSPDGTSFSLFDHAENKATIFDCSKKDELKKVSEIDDCRSIIGFSSDEIFLTTGNNDRRYGNPAIFDRKKNIFKNELKLSTLERIQFHYAEYYLTKDNRYLYITCSGNDLYIYEIATDSFISQINLNTNGRYDERLYIHASEDESTFIIVNSQGNTIYILDRHTKKNIYSYRIANTGNQDTIKLSHNGEYLAIYNDDKTIQIYSLKANQDLIIEPILVIPTSLVEIKEFKFSPNGKQLLAISKNQSFGLFDISSLQQEDNKKNTTDDLKNTWWQNLSFKTENSGSFLQMAMQLPDDEFCDTVASYFAEQKNNTVSSDQIKTWIKELNHEEFRIRQNAYELLLANSELANVILLNEAKTNSSAELRAVNTAILTKMNKPKNDPNEIRWLRVIGILESKKSEKAIKLLKKIANGPDYSYITKAARESVHRVDDQEKLMKAFDK